MEDILATSYPGYDLVTRFNDIDHQHDSSISSDDDQDSDDENDSGKKILHELNLVKLSYDIVWKWHVVIWQIIKLLPKW